MRLDEDARVFVVHLAKVFPGGNGLVDASVKVGGLADSDTVGADAAGVGQAIRFLQVQTIQGLRKFDGKRVFARSARPAQDERLRKTDGSFGLAQMADRRLIAEEVAETYGFRLAG